MEDKRVNNGGSRIGAGRKPLNKKRTVISFTIEPERKKELKTKYPGTLNALFNKWQKKL